MGVKQLESPASSGKTLGSPGASHGAGGPSQACEELPPEMGKRQGLLTNKRHDETTETLRSKQVGIKDGLNNNGKSPGLLGDLHQGSVKIRLRNAYSETATSSAWIACARAKYYDRL